MELSVYFRCILVVMGALLFPPYLPVHHRPGDAQRSEYITVGEATFPHPTVKSQSWSHIHLGVRDMFSRETCLLSRGMVL